MKTIWKEEEKSKRKRFKEDDFNERKTRGRTI